CYILFLLAATLLDTNRRSFSGGRALTIPTASRMPILVLALLLAFAGKAPAHPEDEIEGYPPDAKELAKAKLEALHSDPKKLAVAKLEAVRLNYQAGEKEFLEGRGTLRFLQTSALRLWETERAVYDQPADQVAALERYWERTKRIED